VEVDPSWVIGPGDTLLKKALGQAVVQFPVSLAKQQADIQTGQRDHIDVKEAAEDATGAALGAVALHVGAKGIEHLGKFAKDLINPLESIPEQGPDDLGKPSIVEGEQPTVPDQAKANEALAPKEAPAPVTPEPTISHEELTAPEAPEAPAPVDAPVVPEDAIGHEDLVASEQPPLDKQEIINEALAPKEAPVAPHDDPIIPDYEIDPYPTELSDVQGRPLSHAEAPANDRVAPSSEPAIPELSPYEDDLLPPANDLPPVSRFNELKTDPDGTKYIHYTTDAGDTLPIKMGIEPDGTAEIAVDQFGDGVNKLGPAEIRKAMYGLMDEYPEIKRFGGYRRSGAGKGRVQEIAPPPRPAPANEAGDGGIVGKLAEKAGDLLSDERGSLGPGKGYRAMRDADLNTEADEEIPSAFYSLAEGLRRAVHARGQMKQDWSDELSKRFAKVAETQHHTSGMEGFHAEKAALRGKMPTPDDFAKITGIEPEDIEAMFNHFRDHSSLRPGESLHAREGFEKLLRGDVPAPNEIRAMAKTLPPHMMRQLIKERSLLSKVMAEFASTANVPRALMASFDLSAPLRQGVFMIGRKEFYTALGPMVKAAFSPKYAEAMRENIVRNKLYPVMEASGLAIGKIVNGKNGRPMMAELAEKEEPFMSKFAEKIPILGVGVRASERAFNTFIYKLRADNFTNMYKLGRAEGKVWDEASTRSLSKMINSFTGRGNLGHMMNNSAPMLNALFFSPRLIKSRFDAINPVFYAKLDPFVRKQAVYSIVRFAAAATSVMGLAKIAGAEVDPNPLNADGWKIKHGNTRWDILGGEQQAVRLMTTLAADMGKTVHDIYKDGHTTGPKYGQKTAMDTAGQFLRNKLSPDIGLLVNIAMGNTPTGEDLNPYKEGEGLVIPMSVSDTIDAVKDLRKEGVNLDKALVTGLLMTLPSYLGTGVSTYEPREKKEKGKDEFSDFDAFDNPDKSADFAGFE
jgi:hypothetical protein